MTERSPSAESHALRSTARAKAKGALAELNLWVGEACFKEPVGKVEGINNYHRVEPMEDSHPPAQATIGSDKYSARSKYSAHFGNQFVLQGDGRYMVEHGETEDRAKRAALKRYRGGISFDDINICVLKSLTQPPCEDGISLEGR